MAESKLQKKGTKNGRKSETGRQCARNMMRKCENAKMQNLKAFKIVKKRLPK